MAEMSGGLCNSDPTDLLTLPVTRAHQETHTASQKAVSSNCKLGVLATLLTSLPPSVTLFYLWTRVICRRHLTASPNYLLMINNRKIE